MTLPRPDLMGSRSVPAQAGRTTSRPPYRLRKILALDDLEEAGRKFLPRMIHGYISGAVERGAAFRDAAEAYLDYAFLPRALKDVSRRQQGMTLFGTEYAAPFGIAPIGGAAIAAYRGDIALAEAARISGLPMIMSATSLIKLEEVQRTYPQAWFQAYLAGEDGRIGAMVDRVGKAGFQVLVVTVDTPVPGNRENNLRSGYSMPIRVTPRVAFDCAMHPRWLVQTLGRTFLRHGMPHFENMEAERGPPMFSRGLGRNFSNRDRLGWRHIELIRRLWPGHLVLKGLLATDDVRLAREAGVDGVILSNHGGRQLDHAVAPLRMLPQIRAEIPDMPLMIDGGIRRGSDVLKALALGARAVFVGRPFVLAAAVAGSAGVVHAARILEEEVDRNMALLGLSELSELSTDHLVKLR